MRRERISVNIRIWCQVRSPIVRNSVAAVITPSPPITPSATSNLARKTSRPRLKDTSAAVMKPARRRRLRIGAPTHTKEKSRSGFEDILRLLLLFFNLTLKEIVPDGPEHNDCSQLPDLIPGRNHDRSEECRPPRRVPAPMRAIVTMNRKDSGRPGRT